MVFVVLIIGIINGFGIGKVFVSIMELLVGNVWGLMVLGFICLLLFLFLLFGLGVVIG